MLSGMPAASPNLWSNGGEPPHPPPNDLRSLPRFLGFGLAHRTRTSVTLALARTCQPLAPPEHRVPRGPTGTVSFSEASAPRGLDKTANTRLESLRGGKTSPAPASKLSEMPAALPNLWSNGEVPPQPRRTTAVVASFSGHWPGPQDSDELTLALAQTCQPLAPPKHRVPRGPTGTVSFSGASAPRGLGQRQIPAKGPSARERRLLRLLRFHWRCLPPSKPVVER